MGTPATPIATVVVIDDDDLVRASLRATLESVGYAVVDHDGAQSYLASLPPERPSCLLVDMRMPRMSGLALLRRLQGEDDAPPVIVMTGHADVPVAVETFRAGAFDFIQKPVAMNALLDLIGRAIEADRARLVERASAVRRTSLASSLSAREREVAAHLVEGMSNKEIARVLDISPSTVERHRDRVFEKMDVRNAVELVGVMSPSPARPAPRFDIDLG